MPLANRLVGSSPRMPYVDEAYCPYCIVDALTHFATLGLVLPEAVQAAEAVFGYEQRSAFPRPVH